MPLDPQVQQLLDQMAALEAPPLEEQSVEAARTTMAADGRPGRRPRSGLGRGAHRPHLHGAGARPPLPAAAPAPTAPPPARLVPRRRLGASAT